MPPFTGNITMLDNVTYTKGMVVPIGTFGVVGNVDFDHKHPSGISGLYSPKGSAGWRASLTIKVNGARVLFHMPVQASDYEAEVTLEAFKELREYLQGYGINTVVVQLARADSRITFSIRSYNTYQQMKDDVADNFVCRLRGGVPMQGVCVVEHLFAGKGGYLARFQGSKNGVRVREHLGIFPKTPAGLDEAGHAWDEAARAAGYREARLNFRD